MGNSPSKQTALHPAKTTCPSANTPRRSASILRYVPSLSKSFEGGICFTKSIDLRDLENEAGRAEPIPLLILPKMPNHPISSMLSP
jgi:hypothetical protein